MATKAYATSASVHSMLLVQAIIDRHKRGVSITKLSTESAALACVEGEGRKKKLKINTKCFVDTSLNCMDRVNKVIQNVKDYKTVAAEIINGDCSDCLILTPDAYVKLKADNLRNNHGRSLRKDIKGTEKQEHGPPAAKDDDGVNAEADEDTIVVVYTRASASSSSKPSKVAKTAKRTSIPYQSSKLSEVTKAAKRQSLPNQGGDPSKFKKNGKRKSIPDQLSTPFTVAKAAKRKSVPYKGSKPSYVSKTREHKSMPEQEEDDVAPAFSTRGQKKKKTNAAPAFSTRARKKNKA